MKRMLLLFLFLLCNVSLMAAYQFEAQGNQTWLTFDASTTVSFEASRSGKDKDHENFIDRGEGIVDYGWYNLETGATGSFLNGASATFSETDSIGLYVKDSQGNIYTTTKKVKNDDLGENLIWGHSKLVDGEVALYGGNNGSNGTHEYYVFKVSTANANGKTPSGQPLPGIIATLVIGGGAVVYLKKRKKLYADK